MGLHETISILLAWAANVTGYAAPEYIPVFEYRPHEFFVEHACGDQECDAMGWYNDQGIVYIDERLKGKDTVFSRSLMVHEFIHYLQDVSGAFDSQSCKDQIKREREAYAFQRLYVAKAYGEVAFIRMQHRTCLVTPT